MKPFIMMILFCLVFTLSSCGGKAEPQVNLPSERTVTATNAAKVGSDAPTAKPVQATQVPAATDSPNKPYDPSIFIIEASGAWRDEIAPEYFADYEMEIYLHKIDANDNRAVVGSYDGVFWMSTTLDTAGYIKNMLGDVPVEMTFDAGGEAVSDNLAIHLNTSDDKGWVNYAITGEDGKPLPLTQDMPVGQGSFVVVAKQVFLDAHANGAQGEKVDYSTTEGTGKEITINYVIHVLADSQESNGQRKVIINFSGEGFNKTVEGTMRRIPGYPEDVSDYLNSPGYRDSTWSRLK